MAHVFMDGEFGLDLLVESELGCFSRSELTAMDLDQYPSPMEIRERKVGFGGSQRGEWVGLEPAYGLREYFLGDLGQC